MVWLHFMDPHLPYAERDALAAEIAPGVTAVARDEARGFLRKLRANAGVAPAPDDLVRRMDRHRAAVLAMYDAETAAVGLAIDDALARVPRLGQGIAIFTADHGEEFLERGFLGHGHTLHDETARVPLVIRLPRMPVAQRVPVPVSQVDLAPTLVALLGLESPSGWSGRPLLSADGAWLGAGPSPVLSELDRFELQPVQQSLVDGPWRLIRLEGPGEDAPVTRRLYHLPDDPGETRDLAAGNPDTVRGLELLLATLQGALPRHAADRREVVVSPHTLEALRALGYIR
jgi:arylsulfatase A-like enzyme